MTDKPKPNHRRNAGPTWGRFFLCALFPGYKPIREGTTATRADASQDPAQRRPPGHIQRTRWICCRICEGPTPEEPTKAPRRQHAQATKGTTRRTHAQPTQGTQTSQTGHTTPAGSPNRDGTQAGIEEPAKEPRKPHRRPCRDGTQESIYLYDISREQAIRDAYKANRDGRKKSIYNYRMNPKQAIRRPYAATRRRRRGTDAFICHAGIAGHRNGIQPKYSRERIKDLYDIQPKQAIKHAYSRNADQHRRTYSRERGTPGRDRNSRVY